MTLVVTGGSGELGRLVTQELLQLVPADDLVVVSRNTAGLAPQSPHGVRLRTGDFNRPESLQAAFAGGERLLLISSTAVGEQRCRQHCAAIEAAVGAGVRHIVYTSSVGIHPRNPCFVIPDHALTERMLADSGVDFTILRMSSYADILAKAIAPHAIATGQWISRAGDGLVAFVDKQDCARAAAHVLTSSGHEGAIYEITGPELLSHRDAAAMAAAIAGRPIDYIVPAERPDKASATTEIAQAETWIGGFSLTQLESFEDAVRAGFYAICSHHVEMITAQPARRLMDVYRANLKWLIPGALQDGS